VLQARCSIVVQNPRAYTHTLTAIHTTAYLYNTTTNNNKQVPKLVRMHSDEMEEVSSVSAGDVVAMFGVDCASMDTFTDGTTQLAMSSMFVPEPVMSLAIKPDLGAKAQVNDAATGASLYTY
jgi:translation elongation factor EF-G